jgi:hypothetical protein
LSYEDGEDAFPEVFMADETINIRNISIKCGNCDTYQTLAAFSRRDEWNVYTYECENEVCDPNVTRTIVEVPRESSHRDFTIDCRFRGQGCVLPSEASPPGPWRGRT